MKTLFFLIPLSLPLAADTLLPADLGPAGPLPQVIRHGTLRVLAPAGGELFRGDIADTPALGVAGGFSDNSISGAESLSIFFDRRNSIDALELGGFGGNDSPVLLSGFPADPGATVSNGTATFSNGTVALTATSFANFTTVSFAAPQQVDLFAISAPDATIGANGVSLISLSHTPQPQVLYREEFPNGLRSARPLADCGWDASSAINENPSTTISPTQTVVNAADLGSGDLGSIAANSGGLTFTSTSGNLYVGTAPDNPLGIVGSYSSTTLSQGENFDLTPADGMVLDEITISGFGANDSPVLLAGFSSDPGATLDNGTASFSGDTLTLTATSYAGLATLTLANPVALATLNVRCNCTQSGAAGVGIVTITYRAATAPNASTAHIAGIFGDDHAELYSSEDEGDTKAIISTEEDWIGHDPARYTGLELSWEQAGGANGANVTVRPMVEVGGQWFASATAVPVAGDNSAFEDKSLAFTTAAADWLTVTLAANDATLGAVPGSDLTGEITNLGFFADFSADDENQSLLLDRLELAGHPLFPDEEPWVFVSAPDFTNSDVGDLSGALYGGPPSSGWDGGATNGATAELEDSFLSFFQSLASESPDLFLVAGDLVEGEWFKDASGRQLIGAVNSDAARETAFVEGSFYYYGLYQNHWFQPNDLRVIACVGDHELGDNDWGINANNTKLIPTMRNEFSRWFTRFPIGQWSTYLPNGRPDRASPDFADTPAPLIYPDRPIGSPHEQTAFAIRHKDTLIISLDVFRHDGPSTWLYPYGGTVKPELEAGQLAWVQNLLTQAEADPTIRHIVTQCHTAILQPVLTTASSGMTYANGESSPLFQAMAAHGVDLHFSGEVHDIAASRHMGVQQIVHGAPPGSRKLNYLVVRISPDQLDCTIKTGRQLRNNSVPKYSPTSANNNGSGYAEMTEPFKADGKILIDKSGPQDVISEGTGFLANIEHDDYLLHYSFDHPTGTRTMPNEGTLPDTNADGSKKWRGDLDSAWQASPDFVTGMFGNALSFDGTGGNPDQVHGGGCPAPINKPRTMAFWMRTTSTGFQNIAGFGNNSRIFGEFSAQVAADGRLRLDIGSYTAAALGAPRIDDGNWHHCAIVVPAWDQSDLGQVIFYIDGTPYSAETSDPNIQLLTTSTSNAGHLRLGRSATSTNSPYVGDLDDFVIWGRALTAAELSLLHTFGTSTLNYDVAKADPLLKAFREGKGVEIDGTTWFYVDADLRGAPGTAYDLNGDYLTPFEPGTGMTTIANEFDRTLRAGIPSVDFSNDQVTLTWNSLPDATYSIESSEDFSSWDEESDATNILSAGTSTSHLFTSDLTPLPSPRFYRVVETP